MNNCEYFHSFLLVYQRVDDVPHPVSSWPDSHPGHSPWWIFQPKTERNESLISHTGGLYGTYMSYYMATIWLLYGYYMVTIWLLYYNMVTIWLLSGYYNHHNMVTICLRVCPDTRKAGTLQVFIGFWVPYLWARTKQFSATGPLVRPSWIYGLWCQKEKTLGAYNQSDGWSSFCKHFKLLGCIPHCQTGCHVIINAPWSRVARGCVIELTCSCESWVKSWIVHPY